jgi:hypothetical protein
VIASYVRNVGKMYHFAAGYEIIGNELFLIERILGLLRSDYLKKSGQPSAQIP